MFAGNPLSYGEGQVLSTLFQEHGKAIVFTPLPISVIDERVLNPVFENSSLTAKDIGAIKKHLLDVYNTLCRYSDTAILIPPRELQMMALLTQSYCQKVPTADPQEVAAYFAYQLAAPLVPQNQQKDFNRFKPHQSLAPIAPSAPPQKSSFCITPSRIPTEQTLNHLFLLREQRQKQY